MKKTNLYYVRYDFHPKSGLTQAWRIHETSVDMDTCSGLLSVIKWIEEDVGADVQLIYWEKLKDDRAKMTRPLTRNHQASRVLDNEVNMNGVSNLRGQLMKCYSDRLRALTVEQLTGRVRVEKQAIAMSQREVETLEKIIAEKKHEEGVDQ